MFRRPLSGPADGGFRGSLHSATNERTQSPSFHHFRRKTGQAQVTGDHLAAVAAADDSCDGDDDDGDDDDDDVDGAAAGRRRSLLFFRTSSCCSTVLKQRSQ